MAQSVKINVNASKWTGHCLITGIILVMLKMKTVTQYNIKRAIKLIGCSKLVESMA